MNLLVTAVSHSNSGETADYYCLSPAMVKLLVTVVSLQLCWVFEYWNILVKLLITTASLQLWWSCWLLIVSLLSGESADYCCLFTALLLSGWTFWFSSGENTGHYYLCVFYYYQGEHFDLTLVIFFQYYVGDLTIVTVYTLNFGSYCDGLWIPEELTDDGLYIMWVP